MISDLIREYIHICTYNVLPVDRIHAIVYFLLIVHIYTLVYFLPISVRQDLRFYAQMNVYF